MPILRNIGLLATCRAAGAQGEIHAIAKAALVWRAGVVLWAGRERDLPRGYHALSAMDAGKRLVIPGLVDCHTHLVFGGWRFPEFSQRLLGRSYLEIARAGGGLLSTAAATRGATASALVNRAHGFLRALALQGVTCVEIKSGYGLLPEAEMKILKVIRELAARQPLRLVPTFLAHAVPAEYRQRRGAYLRLLVEEMLPAVARGKLADFCDVFMEKGAFTRGEAGRILAAAGRLGLGLKLHADQLSSGGGAELAGALGAASADHLEYVSAQGIRALKRAGTVAALLPLPCLHLGLQPPPARRFIEAGVPVAVASDFNPGTNPACHLPYALALAVPLLRMTPAEVLKGATIHAARALRRDHVLGSLEPGKSADFSIPEAESPEEWLLGFRENSCAATTIAGRRVTPGGT